MIIAHRSVISKIVLIKKKPSIVVDYILKPFFLLFALDIFCVIIVRDRDNLLMNLY